MSESSSAIPSPNPTSPAWSFYVDNLQTFNLTNVYGNSTQFTVWDISQFNYFIMATITIQGFVLGFTSMLLILLTILTPFHKAKRPIFIINYIALVLACMKAILVVSYYGGTKFIWGWGEEKLGAYAQYSFSLQVGPGIFSAVLTIPLYACVLFSLILQVRVVFAMEPITRKVITVFLTLSALVLLGLQTAWQAYGIQEEINPNKPLNLNNNTWNAFHIGFPLFISISCLLFLYKLGITIYRRRNMGFKQFGPLQVLVIMFGQCLIIPEALLLADLDPNIPFNGLSVLALDLLVCSLPLSALWASHESEGTHRNNLMSSSAGEQSPTSSSFRRFLRSE